MKLSKIFTLLFIIMMFAHLVGFTDDPTSYLDDSAFSDTNQQTIEVPEGDVTSLINAIIDANDNPEDSTVITVSGTYKLNPDADSRIPFEHDGNNGLPSINTPITIIGDGAIIERDSDLFNDASPCDSELINRFRIFHITNTGYLTLENIEAVRYGCPAGSGDERRGGAMFNLEGKVTLINSSVMNNEAYRGGGIYSDGGDVIVDNSSISNNVARATIVAGGGIHNRNGGSVFVKSGSIFNSNSATASRGRGGGIGSETGFIEITGSTFSDNIAGRGGAGIHKRGSEILNIHNSIFSGNVSDDAGGGIEIMGSGHMIIFNSNFSNNEADSDGGAIRNISSGDLTIFNNTITGNSAGENGGGIYIAGSGTNEIGKSTITNNNAGEFGGGIANRRDLTVSNTLISENHAGDGGGGIDNEGTNRELKVVNSTLRSNTTGQYGGAIRNAVESLSHLSFTTIDNNVADNQGGGIWNEGEFEIKNSIVANSAGVDCHNEGAVNAEGENIDSDGTCPGFSHSNTDPLLDPEGLQDHGGPTLSVALTEGSPAINAVSNCTDLDGVIVVFDQRDVSRPQGAACDIGAFEFDDDGLIAEGNVTQLIDFILDANANPDEPAVIEINGIYTLSPEADERIPFDHNGNTGLPAITSDITIKGNAATIRRDPGLGCIRDNIAQTGEFRIFYISEDGDLTLENLQAVRHGCADGSNNERYGGAIYNEGGAVALANVSLLDNTAHNGGDIYTDGGEINIQSTTLSGSEAINNGGGIYSRGDVVVDIDESTFAGLIASRGAGIYGTDGMWMITGSTFENNRVSSSFRNGGGILSTDGNWVVSHSTFSGNEAGGSNGHGGGILADGNWTITESTFSNNTAGNDGGGIRKTGSSDMEITETVFTENEAGRHGGGFSTQREGEVTISNSTFTQNSAGLNGGAVDGQSWRVNMEIVNSILTGNSAVGHGGGIASRGEVIVRKSTIANNSTQEGGGAGIDNSTSYGNLTVINSTFWNNSANTEGGAILNGEEGSANILASTITGNSALNGGGISNEEDASMSVKNSIVSESLSGGDCNPGEMFNAEGENISSDASCPQFSHPNTDPLLDASGMQDYGGPTPTIAIMPGSPATDAVTDCTDHEGNPVETDQRGVNRPQGVTCDIGSFESEQLDPGELAIHPDEGGNQGVITVTIFGTWFDEGYTVKLVSDGHPVIDGTITDVLDNGTRISVRFDLTGQPTGERDLVVNDNQGVPTTLSDAFTIIEGSEPEVWAEVQGADRITGGMETNVNITYGNRGNADIHDVLLYISLPSGLNFSTDDVILPDMDELDGSEPPYFEAGKLTVLPLWLYRIPANSAGIIRLQITPPDPAWFAPWHDLFDEPIHVEIAAAPFNNDFARTGDFEHDPLLALTYHDMVFEEVVGDGSSTVTAGNSVVGVTALSDPIEEYQQSQKEFLEAAEEAVPSGRSVVAGYALGLGTVAACAAAITGVGLKLCIAGTAASGVLAIADVVGAFAVLSDHEAHGPEVCPSEPDPEDVVCAGTASRTFGHPHFMTFDRMDYDFQAVGEFVLTRSTIDETEVQIRLEQFDPQYEDFTIITAAAMNVAGDAVAFDEDRESFENVPDLRINGAATDLPEMGSAPMALPNGGTITRAGRTFMVAWPDGQTRVDVRQSATVMGMIVEPMLAPMYSANLEGLLGTADGNSETDFTLRDGTVLIPPLSFDELYRDFGDSWRITDEESLFGTPTFANLDVPTQHITTEDLDPQAVADAEEVCASYGVKDPILMDNCVFDVAITGDERFAEDTIELITPKAKEQVDDWMADDESKIQISVESDPKTDEEFSFSTTGGLESFTLIDDENRSDRSQTIAFARVSPSTYEFTQQLPDEEDWEVSEITCQGGEDIVTDHVTGTVTIDLGEGEVVRCTYVNSGPAAVSVDDDDPELPRSYSLEQNYPNPFNPATNIEFALPEAVEVNLAVYDILGRRVAILVDEYMQAGYHQVTFDAGHLASGVYIYRIRAEEFTDTRKLTLIK